MSAFEYWPDKPHQARLLAWVRRVAQSHLQGVNPGDPPVFSPPTAFGGAFVTFWSQETLRGCVGRFEKTTNLAGTLRDVTMSSLGDRRFERCPITHSELGSLTIEISLLSDPVVAKYPLSIQIGTHGIIVRSQNRSGCFLPKVAVERDWTAEEFLSNCCSMKAGLRSDAWRDASSTVHVFTATVFSDAKTREHVAHDASGRQEPQ